MKKKSYIHYNLMNKMNKLNLNLHINLMGIHMLLCLSLVKIQHSMMLQ